jgi:hypothetical protein
MLAKVVNRLGNICSILDGAQYDSWCLLSDDVANIKTSLFWRAAHQKYLYILGRGEVKTPRINASLDGAPKQRVPSGALARVTVSKNRDNDFVFHRVMRVVANVES